MFVYIRDVTYPQAGASLQVKYSQRGEKASQV